MRELKISRHADPAFVDAFRSLARRLRREAKASVRAPITMYLAGGAAVHFYTGARMTDDIDAVFDRKLLVPTDMAVIFRGAEGKARSLHVDASYNESFTLMHEDAHDDALRLVLDGIEGVEVRVLQPVDLAVSKLARFSEIDRGDIRQLGQAGLVNGKKLRARAEDAMQGYVGDHDRIRTSLRLACSDLENIAR